MRCAERGLFTSDAPRLVAAEKAHSTELQEKDKDLGGLRAVIGAVRLKGLTCADNHWDRVVYSLS